MTQDESKQFMRIVDMMDRYKERLSMNAERTQVRVNLATSRSPLDFRDTEFLIELVRREEGR